MTDIQANARRVDTEPVTEFDVIVLGAGFAGLYLVYRFRELGYSVRAFERADGVGGTWRANRYPGARCDVESMEYSYSFSPELEQEWEWTERYPPQPEILRYLEHVADRFDLRKDIQFNTEVRAASFDDRTGRWKLTTANGATYSTQFFVLAVGCLSSKLDPPFDGLESFQGRWYHTASWPREGVDFTNKRVGVVGTGSTGIQVIPQVARQADHLDVFQRTPNFSMPAQNRLLNEEFKRDMKARYQEHRQAAKESLFGVPIELNMKSALEMSPEEARAELDKRWEHGGAAAMLLAFRDLLINEEANTVAAEYVRDRIRETVKDPATAELLCPKDHFIGTKRPCVDIDYFETYNRENVSLIDVREAPIEEVLPNGIRLADGQEFELDVIVFAIGFDAMTGSLLNIDIRGRDGLSLQTKWADGPRTYLGLATSGFPNMFLVTGPGSPSVLSNMVVSIEQHVDWIVDCLQYVRGGDHHTIEATADAEQAWVQHCTGLADATLFPRTDTSWYAGGNVPGKPRIFMPYVGGVGAYRQTCENVVAEDYEGFAIHGATHSRKHPSDEFAAVLTDTSP